MGNFDRSTACLRLFGDNLDPGEISLLLGCQPTVAEFRGEIVRYPSGRERIARVGQWRLEAQDVEPENLADQIRWLLTQVTEDLSVWQRLQRMCEMNLFCGLFMASGNDGVSIPPSVMLMLGQRGIALDCDVYSYLDE